MPSRPGQLFGFPPAPRPAGGHYHSNFLKTVIFQLKFAEKDVLAAQQTVQEALEGGPWNHRDVRRGGFTVQLQQQQGNRTPLLVQEVAGKGGVEFRSENAKRVYSLLPDTITLTVIDNDYTSFETEFPPFWKVAQSAALQLGIEDFSRLAVRKINLYEFQQPPEGSAVDFLSVVFKSDLVQSSQAFPSQAGTSSAIQRIEMVDGSRQLKLSYGLTPQIHMVGEVSRRIATLDIDVFNEATPVARDAVVNEMQLINETVYNVFDYVVTDQLRQLMSGGQDGPK